MATLSLVKKGMAIDDLMKMSRIVQHPELPEIFMAGQRLHLLSDTVDNIHFIVASADGAVSRVFNRVKNIRDKVTLLPFRQIIRDERGMYFFKVLANKPAALEAFKARDSQKMIAASPLFYGLSRAYVESGAQSITGKDTREVWAVPQWVGVLRGDVKGTAINFSRKVVDSPALDTTRVVYEFTRDDGDVLTLENKTTGVSWSKASEFLSKEDITAILASFYKL